MKDLSPSDLKTILHSKRANLYCLEHCRVMQKDGRVLYLTEAKKGLSPYTAVNSVEVDGHLLSVRFGVEYIKSKGEADGRV